MIAHFEGKCKMWGEVLVRSEECHSRTKQGSQHRAKRAIKRRLKPSARGLVGSRGKALSGVNFLFDFAHKKWAEPHSA